MDFEPASSRCVPLFARLLFIVSPGSVRYAKQAELPASTFANQFVCAAEPAGVKDAAAGQTAPLCATGACGTAGAHGAAENGLWFYLFYFIFFFLPLTPAGQRDDHGKGERVCVLAGPWGGPLALRGLRAAALW